ncbi:MAG TPA: TIGR03936 family radical SAM-associated protein [Thermoclostridium sp.]
MKIRFQFERREELKYIGHLDVMRLFERAFKRAEIPVTHSQGFNPRPHIVFAQPMPLGLSSDGEFADVELDGSIDTGAFIEKLNRALPDGIRVVDARENTGKKNIMAIVEAARYRIDFKAGVNPDIESIISNVLGRKRIIVIKKTKSGEREFDIRPLIYELSGEISNDTGYFNVLLSAGQDDNVRPELFITGVSACINRDIEITRMHRIMLYGRAEGKWLPLTDGKFM